MEGYSKTVPGISYIYWKPENRTAPLYKSEAPHAGFEKVADLDLTEGEYQEKVEISEGKHLYYKIGDTLLWQDDYPNQYAREIMRRDHWFLQSKRHSGGTSAYAFIRRTRGEHCPDCWDDINQKVTRSNCKTCLGTGMKEPYYPPLEFYGDFRPSNAQTMITRDRVLTDSYNSAFWTTNLPLFKPRDIIVYKRARFRVVSGINYSRMSDFITKQFVPLEAIENHKPAFDIVKPPEEADFSVDKLRDGIINIYQANSRE